MFDRLQQLEARYEDLGAQLGSTEIADAETLMGESDPDLRAMAMDELEQLQARLPKIEADLKVLLLPKDPNDEKNVVLEIRAGTGGDEASLFAAEVFKMYVRFA